MKKIKILIVDDHDLIRMALKIGFEEKPDIQIVGSSTNGNDAIQSAAKLKPDVILMDYKLPDIDGALVTKTILENNPDIKILFLTGNDDLSYLDEYIKSGANGVLFKDSPIRDIHLAVCTVYEGKHYFCKEINEEIVNRYIGIINNYFQSSGLSKREEEVLKLIAEGLQNKEIADKLFISISTVKTHRERIMEKLDLHSSSDLVRYAVKKGIISIPQEK